MQEDFATTKHFSKHCMHLIAALSYLASHTFVVLFPTNNLLIKRLLVQHYKVQVYFEKRSSLNYFWVLRFIGGLVEVAQEPYIARQTQSTEHGSKDKSLKPCKSMFKIF